MLNDIIMKKESNTTGRTLPKCALAAGLLFGGFFTANIAAGQAVIDYDTPDADTYIDAASPNSNFGSSAGLIVRYASNASFRRKTYVRFDLFAGGNEPNLDGTISDAELTIYYAGFGGSVPATTYTIYGLAADYQGGDGLLGQDWGEFSLTSNNAPWDASSGAVPSYLSLVGTFAMPASADAPPSDTPFTISGEPLAAFINDSLNSGEDFSNLVTFVVFQESSNDGANTSWFARTHATGTAPSLSVTVIPEPETVGLSMAIMALGMVAYARRRNRAARV